MTHTIWSLETIVRTRSTVATHICRLCEWPTPVLGLRCYLCGGGSPDEAEAPHSLHDEDHSGRTGHSLLRQGVPLPQATRYDCLVQRATIHFPLLETPMFVAED